MDALTSARFAETKRIYDKVLPEWMAEYQRTGNMYFDPYVKDWLIEFSPIENNVWSDIRGSAIPFYPQIPVAGYFLDFACPMKKMAIECDGAEFHDADKDAARDEELGRLGWTVFRLKGHECKRLIDEPWLREPDLDLDYQEKLGEWFDSTSAGLVYSIKQKYFSRILTEFAKEHGGYIDHAIHIHRTTPYENLPGTTA